MKKRYLLNQLLICLFIGSILLDNTIQSSNDTIKHYLALANKINLKVSNSGIILPKKETKAISKYLFVTLFFHLELYLIHRLQHLPNHVYSQLHKVHHHNYHPKEITRKSKKEKGLVQSLDQYFYTTFLVVIPLNVYCHRKDYKLHLYIAMIGFIEFYLHHQYHTCGSFFEQFKWFKWLASKHRIHHMYPKTNFFLVNPLFDYLFGTYKGKQQRKSLRS